MDPIKNLEKFGLDYTILDRDGIQAKLPFQNLPDDWLGVDMPDNGTINVPLLLRTLTRLCRSHGVDFLEYATVAKISADHTKMFPPANWRVQGTLRSPAGVSVQGREFGFRTDKIALTPGAYVNHVLFPSFGFTLNVDIWEMVSFDPSGEPEQG
jgi:sarcosine oxidase / L-pipecolate oxidase